MNPSYVDLIKSTAKAVAASLVVAAAYLVGVVPATGGFGDVTVVQWLGLVVFMGGAFGITYAVPWMPVGGSRGSRGSQTPYRGASRDRRLPGKARRRARKNPTG